MYNYPNLINHKPNDFSLRNFNKLLARYIIISVYLNTDNVNRILFNPDDIMLSLNYLVPHLQIFDQSVVIIVINNIQYH